MALPVQVLSPLDGRYQAAVAPLGEYLSEAGLNRARVHVEVEWLIALSDQRMFGSEPLSSAEKASLRELVTGFGQIEIDELATLEATTRHDVKAVEYLVRARLENLGLRRVSELTHFACTSEDINNVAYALIVRDAIHNIWLPAFDAVITELRSLAHEHRAVPMLCRTHGQPATPSTMGKELAVFAHRLLRIRDHITRVTYLAKFSGATGTFSAHVAADSNADWAAISRTFIEKLGLAWNPLTTQIESHDWQAELYSHISHGNRIVHNLATDMWTYISLGFFRQIPQVGATGSSTMPHKINPIRFENAEANLELSCAVLDSLAATLVTSRMQRDLTDSTTQRNIGVGLGHSLLALDNVRRGLGEVDLDVSALERDLEANWEVLGEAIQTVIRAEVVAGNSQISDPYALLKDLTRGKKLTPAALAQFVGELDISAEAKTRLLALTPSGYVGRAAELVDFLD